MATTPMIQKAWTVSKRGNPSEVLRVSDNVPVLRPGKGEVLVRLHAGALNPLGYKAMQIAPNFLARRPCGVEYEFSGVVEEIGLADIRASSPHPNEDLKTGDLVYGILVPWRSVSKSQGALSQYAVAPAEAVARIPLSNGSYMLSLDEAAGLSFAAITAYGALQCLRSITPKQQKDRQEHVLINGGTSALGIMAIQMTKALGWKITATTSTKNVDFVKEMGVDEVIDYKAIDQPLHTYLPHHNFGSLGLFTAIIDCISNEPIELYYRSKPYLVEGGTFTSLGAPVPRWGQLPVWLWGAIKIGVIGVTGRRRNDYAFSLPTVYKYLPQVNELVAQGTIHTVIDTIYEFDDAQKAYEKIMTGRAVGKLIVRAPTS